MTTVPEGVVKRLIKADDCCGSCHTDADEYGYSLAEIDFGRGRVAYVCCACRLAYDRWVEAGRSALENGKDKTRGKYN